MREIAKIQAELTRAIAEIRKPEHQYNTAEIKRNRKPDKQTKTEG